MNALKSFVYAGALCAVLAPGPALADIIVWKDPVQGFLMTYPDSWTVQTQDIPSTRLRIAAPVGPDLATCRMQVRKDGRARIYPKALLDDAAVEYLDMEYWEGEIHGQYDNARILDFRGPVGLGDVGDATGVRYTFTQNDGQGDAPMAGFMMASLYGDKLYQASCSSRAEQYERWMPVFVSIFESIELAPRYHPFAPGEYRNFLKDPKLHLVRTKPGTTYEGFKGGWWDWLMTDKYHK